MVNLKMFTFTLLLIIIILIHEISSQDYCYIKSCPSQGHTMCLYDSDPASACGDESQIELGLSSSQQEEILNLINYLRAFVASGQEQRGSPGPQPAATNLEPLTWDDELATIAQRWANQCNAKHDQCRNVDRFIVGQNFASETSLNEYPNNLTSLIIGWYNEVEQVSNLEVHALSHFTHYAQLVWADTKTIGCGAINYYQYFIYTSYLVCNFGPTGNILGRPMYNGQ